MSSSLSANDIEAIRQLLKLVTENGLSELSITVREGVSVTIKCETARPAQYQLLAPQQQYAASSAQLTQPGPQTSLAAPAASAPKSGTPVPSPATGIFYQAPSPGDPPFIKVGDTVKVGQVIGLLEAMKVFSDVHSDAAGRVTEISAVDGQLVRDGEPLIFVQA